ncbi:MAG: hypothetical protein KDC32_00755 [Saprospiraceae bacterium]|nr:hypothetical protein [Saprospiraceae bacterium]
MGENLFSGGVWGEVSFSLNFYVLMGVLALCLIAAFVYNRWINGRDKSIMTWKLVVIGQIMATIE